MCRRRPACGQRASSWRVSGPMIVNFSNGEASSGSLLMDRVIEKNQDARQLQTADTILQVEAGATAQRIATIAPAQPTWANLSCSLSVANYRRPVSRSQCPGPNSETGFFCVG